MKRLPGLADSLVPLLACLVLACSTGTAVAEEYEYDAAGRLSRVTYDTGQIVDYFYDNNSNITAIVATAQVSADPELENRILEYSLGGVLPNPASRAARLRFSLAKDGEISLRFFDVAGRLVHSIEREYPAGEYEIQVNVSKWAAGVYFYRLKASDFSAQRRLVVLN